ncbi:MAG: hypothetical protein UW41_C0016G0032 [Candidatus Collierbacteria bacterium GW2011_GWC2_44_18]|uniref:Uncharacterized protein n=2 Tax=Microgenomates group TaxID=1794810 RepID=A0A0G1M5L7_9BACT|nr:MAG: hypothetical protein UW16_C0027G0004 [Microgenomates group bacterium GW2011_GWC1_44_10]KKT48895.1 MAG: hypothetical protein UW41_C0016G0032 [Candidatus Collierbacteria bacterium GW2011_GWC2_44_18]KKT67219.1 MAG: hypothetical protein UW60_C0011G0019 [Candidatus Woesebacteria bacterium GW2011_GWA2_44_33]
MKQDLVRFTWNHGTYTIPADTEKRRILLSSGRVLTFNGFLESFPPQLNELREFNFHVEVGLGSNLSVVADQLDAVLAKAITVTTVKTCPQGCPNQNDIFCSICGSRLDVKEVVLPFVPDKPKPFQNPANPVDVMGNDPCPNCHKPLDHGAHAKSCPHCGQTLHWTCRDGHNTLRDALRDNLH